MKKFIVKDSGKRKKFKTGAVRDTQDGKPRPALISPFFKERLGHHMAKGALKYGDHNWQKGIDLMRCLDSAERHLMEFEQGLVDEDHLSAAVFNLMAIIHTQECIKRGFLPKELDNLPKYEKKNHSRRS